MTRIIRFLRYLIAGFMLSLALVVTPVVHAVTTPSFPSCVNPQGTLKVSYSEGTHGIVGNSATYTGSDAVYTISDAAVMQCFCADDGTGIQTNWWDVAGFSDTDIQTLKNDGWLFVPNGSLWGLSNDPYLARNSSYSCKAGTGGGQTAGTSAIGGTNLGTGGDVLGLASTGNISFLILLAMLSLGSFVISGYLRRRQA